MHAGKTLTLSPSVVLAEAEVAQLKAKLPVSMDALAVAQKTFNRNKFRNKNPLHRFLDKVIIHKPTGCWIWLSARNKAGYGRFRLNGSYMAAHRASLVLFNGFDPGELLACHTCDIRQCVNPDHLFVGSAQANIDDCISKGRRRYQSGSGRYNARLHEQDVVAAWILRLDFGFSVRKIAALFSVATSTIGNIFWSESHWPKLKAVIATTDRWQLLYHFGLT